MFSGTMEDLDGAVQTVKNLDVNQYEDLYGAPLTIVRGKPCTFWANGFMGIPPLDVFLSEWSVEGGDPVASWDWYTTYKVPYDYPKVTPLMNNWGWLGCCFMTAKSGAEVECDSWPNPYEEGSAALYIDDPTPTATDQHFWVEPCIPESDSEPCVLNDLDMSIPPTQVDYPFTGQPSIRGNAAGAGRAFDAGYASGPPDLPPIDKGCGVAYSSRLIYLLCKHGTLGDWANADRFYRDLDFWPPMNNDTVQSRRLGANFNFGAMMQAGGFSCWDSLEIAIVVGGGNHGLEMQEAVACGWLWEDNQGLFSRDDYPYSNAQAPVSFDLPGLPPTDYKSWLSGPAWGF
jgi:hypothetical protein